MGKTVATCAAIHHEESLPLGKEMCPTPVFWYMSFLYHEIQLCLTCLLFLWDADTRTIVETCLGHINDKAPTCRFNCPLTLTSWSKQWWLVWCSIHQSLCLQVRDFSWWSGIRDCGPSTGHCILKKHEAVPVWTKSICLQSADLGDATLCKMLTGIHRRCSLPQKTNRCLSSDPSLWGESASAALASLWCSRAPQRFVRRLWQAVWRFVRPGPKLVVSQA